MPDRPCWPAEHTSGQSPLPTTTCQASCWLAQCKPMCNVSRSAQDQLRWCSPITIRPTPARWHCNKPALRCRWWTRGRSLPSPGAWWQRLVLPVWLSTPPALSPWPMGVTMFAPLMFLRLAAAAPHAVLPVIWSACRAAGARLCTCFRKPVASCVLLRVWRRLCLNRQSRQFSPLGLPGAISRCT